MKSHLVGLLLGALFTIGGATACKNKDATPTGTVLTDWNPSQATRASFTKAAIGARTKRDVRMKLEPPNKGGPIEITLAIEYAPVDFEEDAKTVHHTSIVSLRAVVAKNEDWTATAKCDGPDYQFGPVDETGKPTTPEAMVLRCNFILKNGPDFTYSQSLWMQGDRVIKPDGSPDVRTTLDG